jgi:hypothetical protein
MHKFEYQNLIYVFILTSYPLTSNTIKPMNHYPLTSSNIYVLFVSWETLNGDLLMVFQIRTREGLICLLNYQLFGENFN